MADFGIHFFLCNIYICIITGMLFLMKRAFKNCLTSRMQFHLWFLLLFLLAVPFFPFSLPGPFQVFFRLFKWKNAVPPDMPTAVQAAADGNAAGAFRQLNDFALSAKSQAPPAAGLIVCGIWLAGILVKLLILLQAKARLNALVKSALPLQNEDVRSLYAGCLKEMNIKRKLPLYSSAYIKSPFITGLCRPRIYLPIHLISDIGPGAAQRQGCQKTSGRKNPGADPLRPLRYMLLHELQHYRHKDAFAGFLMNLFSVLYWFHPFVKHALKTMRIDREIACDASVLELLDESSYADYGAALLDLAEKISFTHPFAAGISGNGKQLHKRILHISTYQKPAGREKLKGLSAFCAASAVLLGLAPLLSADASDKNHYAWNPPSEKLTILSEHDKEQNPNDAVDVSAYFNGYEGSFVLYSQKNDAWSIYNMEHAVMRISPDSTYKIYSALFGLEEGILTPEDSFAAWDGTNYPFEAWNADQDLHSAMQSSVNWYFQNIDAQLGAASLQRRIKEIGYGNENTASGLSSFWMEASLKISPVEQVLLLTALYDNRFGFAPENIDAVKDSICLFSADDHKKFYGKTGTGRIGGHDVNGWFIGFVEHNGSASFFAANIQNDTGASGSRAAEITMSVLSALHIWK